MATTPEDWKATWIGHFLDQYGFPLVACAVMCYAAWSIASWAAPKADKLIETHVKAVEKIEATQAEITESIRKQAENGEGVREVLEKINVQQSSDGATLRDIHNNTRK